MTLWQIALGLIVLILLPRLLIGQTPQDHTPDEPRRLRRSGFRDDRPSRPPSPAWVYRR